MWVLPGNQMRGRGALDQASLYRLRSTTSSPLHPRADRGVGGSRSGGHQAPGKNKAACGALAPSSSILVAVLAPQIFPGTLLLSPSFFPHSSALSPLRMASVATLPPSFPNVSETFLWVSVLEVPRTLGLSWERFSGISWALGRGPLGWHGCLLPGGAHHRVCPPSRLPWNSET